MKINVITGATGLLGSHIAENLRARGETVRALVRAGSDTAFLRNLGVELVVGDLASRESLDSAMRGATVAYHCAARVRDWGPWRRFREEVVDTTARAVEAAHSAGVERFVHVSSISAYGHPAGYGSTGDTRREFTEDEPLGQNPWIWDNYARSKTEADQLIQKSPVCWTVVRPSAFYGPRDRGMLPRAIAALSAGRVALIGSGDNLLNFVYAGDVAEGAILAANSPLGVRRAYNLTSPGEITQREFLDFLTTELGLPAVRRHVPFRVAHGVGLFSEVIGKLIRIERSPHITRHSVYLMGRSTRYSSGRAGAELGWQPRMPIRDGLRQALDWRRGQMESRK